MRNLLLALVAAEEPDSKVFKATKINFSPEAPPIRENDSFTRRRDFVKHTLGKTGSN